MSERNEFTLSPPIFIPDSFKGYPIASFCLQHVPAEDLESVLIPGGLVRDRIERLGFDISSDLGNKEFIFLCVLKGGFQFFNQLLEVVRQYHRFNANESLKGIVNGKARRIQAEFIRLVSYEDDASLGSVRIIGVENLASLREQNIIVVEDIVDTGTTMQTLLKELEKQKPKSVRVASLFFKRTSKNKDNYRPNCKLTEFHMNLSKKPIELVNNNAKTFISYIKDIGFSIPDSFIVGCNLDYNNYFRDLQHVCVISNTGKQRYKKVAETNGMKSKC